VIPTLPSARTTPSPLSWFSVIYGNGIQTLTNKTLTSSTINTPFISDDTFDEQINSFSPTNINSIGIRQITTLISNPSGGANGDLWFKYV
jgi:hypothetical protein